MAIGFASHPELRQPWAAGIILSAICLVLQHVLFALRPALSHVDQKIIMQLSAARLVLSFLQYVFNTSTHGTFVMERPFNWGAVLSLSHYFEAVVVCWMCFYYKSLRQQCHSKIPLQKWNFTVLSVVIWSATIPVGVFYFFFFTYMKYIFLYEMIFDGIKASVMVAISVTFILNCIYLFFCGATYKSNYLMVGKCFFLILVFLMAAEFFIKANYTSKVSEIVIFVFYLVDSFHVLAYTVLFVIPVEAPSGVVTP